MAEQLWRGAVAAGQFVYDYPMPAAYAYAAIVGSLAVPHYFPNITKIRAPVDHSPINWTDFENNFPYPQPKKMDSDNKVVEIIWSGIETSTNKKMPRNVEECDRLNHDIDGYLRLRQNFKPEWINYVDCTDRYGSYLPELWTAPEISVLPSWLHDWLQGPNAPEPKPKRPQSPDQPRKPEQPGKPEEPGKSEQSEEVGRPEEPESPKESEQPPVVPTRTRPSIAVTTIVTITQIDHFRGGAKHFLSIDIYPPQTTNPTPCYQTECQTWTTTDWDHTAIRSIHPTTTTDSIDNLSSRATDNPNPPPSEPPYSNRTAKRDAVVTFRSSLPSLSWVTFSRALQLLQDDPWGLIKNDISSVAFEVFNAAQAFRYSPWKFLRDGFANVVVGYIHGIPEIPGLSFRDKVEICRKVMAWVFPPDLFGDVCTHSREVHRAAAMKRALLRYPSPPLLDWIPRPVVALYQSIPQAMTVVSGLVRHYIDEAVPTWLRNFNPLWWFGTIWIPWRLAEVRWLPWSPREITRCVFIIAATIIVHILPVVHYKFHSIKDLARILLLAFTAWVGRVLYADLGGICFFDIEAFFIGFLISRYIYWFAPYFLTKFPRREFDAYARKSGLLVLSDAFAVWVACELSISAEQCPHPWFWVTLISILSWSAAYHFTRLAVWNHETLDLGHLRDFLPPGTLNKIQAWRAVPLQIGLLVTALCIWRYGYMCVEWNMMIVAGYFGMRTAYLRPAPPINDASTVEEILTRRQALAQSLYKQLKEIQNNSVGRRFLRLPWVLWLSSFLTTLFGMLLHWTWCFAARTVNTQQCPKFDTNREPGIFILASIPIGLKLLELYCRDLPEGHGYRKLINPLKFCCWLVSLALIVVGAIWATVWGYWYQDIPLLTLTALLWSLMGWRFANLTATFHGLVELPGRGTYRLYSVPVPVDGSVIEIDVNHLPDIQHAPIPEKFDPATARIVDTASGQPVTVSTLGLPDMIIRSELVFGAENAGGGSGGPSGGRGPGDQRLDTGEPTPARPPRPPPPSPPPPPTATPPGPIQATPPAPIVPPPDPIAPPAGITAPGLTASETNTPPGPTDQFPSTPTLAQRSNGRLGLNAGGTSYVKPKNGVKGARGSAENSPASPSSHSPDLSVGTLKLSTPELESQKDPESPKPESLEAPPTPKQESPKEPENGQQESRPKSTGSSRTKASPKVPSTPPLPPHSGSPSISSLDIYSPHSSGSDSSPRRVLKITPEDEDENLRVLLGHVPRPGTGFNPSQGTGRGTSSDSTTVSDDSSNEHIPEVPGPGQCAPAPKNQFIAPKDRFPDDKDFGVNITAGDEPKNLPPDAGEIKAPGNQGDGNTVTKSDQATFEPNGGREIQGNRTGTEQPGTESPKEVIGKSEDVPLEAQSTQDTTIEVEKTPKTTPREASIDTHATPTDENTDKARVPGPSDTQENVQDAVTPAALTPDIVPETEGNVLEHTTSKETKPVKDDDPQHNHKTESKEERTDDQQPSSQDFDQFLSLTGDNTELADMIWEIADKGSQFQNATEIFLDRENWPFFVKKCDLCNSTPDWRDWPLHPTSKQHLDNIARREGKKSTGARPPTLDELNYIISRAPIEMDTEMARTLWFAAPDQNVQAAMEGLLNKGEAIMKFCSVCEDWFDLREWRAHQATEWHLDNIRRRRENKEPLRPRDPLNLGTYGLSESWHTSDKFLERAAMGPRLPGWVRRTPTPTPSPTVAAPDRWAYCKLCDRICPKIAHGARHRHNELEQAQVLRTEYDREARQPNGIVEHGGQKSVDEEISGRRTRSGEEKLPHCKICGLHFRESNTAWQGAQASPDWETHRKLRIHLQKMIGKDTKKGQGYCCVCDERFPLQPLDFIGHTHEHEDPENDRRLDKHLDSEHHRLLEEQMRRGEIEQTNVFCEWCNRPVVIIWWGEHENSEEHRSKKGRTKSSGGGDGGGGGDNRGGRDAGGGSRGSENVKVKDKTYSDMNEANNGRKANEVRPKGKDSGGRKSGTGKPKDEGDENREIHHERPPDDAIELYTTENSPHLLESGQIQDKGKNKGTVDKSNLETSRSQQPDVPDTPVVRPGKEKSKREDVTRALEEARRIRERENRYCTPYGGQAIIRGYPKHEESEEHRKKCGRRENARGGGDRGEDGGQGPGAGGGGGGNENQGGNGGGGTFSDWNAEEYDSDPDDLYSTPDGPMKRKVEQDGGHRPVILDQRMADEIYLPKDLQRKGSKEVYRADGGLVPATQHQSDDEPGNKADDTPEDTPEDTLAVEPEDKFADEPEVKPDDESQTDVKSSPHKSTEDLLRLGPGNSRNTQDNQSASTITDRSGVDPDDGASYVGDVHEDQADKILDGRKPKFRGRNPKKGDFATDQEWEEMKRARKLAQKLREQAMVAQMSEADQLRHRQEKALRKQRRKANKKRNKEAKGFMEELERSDQKSSGFVFGEQNIFTAEQSTEVGVEPTVTQPEELLKEDIEEYRLSPHIEDQYNDRPHVEPEDRPEDKPKEMPDKTPEDRPAAPEIFHAKGTQISSTGGTVDADRDTHIEKGIEEKPGKKRFSRLRKRDFNSVSEWQNHKLSKAARQENKKMQMSEEERMRFEQNEADKKRKKKEYRVAKKARERMEAAGLSAENVSEMPGDTNAAERDDAEELDLIKQTRTIKETRLGDEMRSGDKTEFIEKTEQPDPAKPKKRRSKRGGYRQTKRGGGMSKQDAIDSKAHSLATQPDRPHESQDAQDSAFFQSLCTQTANDQIWQPEREVNDVRQRLRLDLEQRRPNIEAERQSVRAVTARESAEALRRQGISERAQDHLTLQGHFNPHTLSIEQARQIWADLPTPVLSPTDFEREDILDPSVRKKIIDHEEGMKNKAAMGELEPPQERMPLRRHSVALHRNVVTDMWPIHIFALDAETYVRPADPEAYGEDNLPVKNIRGQPRRKSAL
ncbi:uncharacterized protein CC84DRAFT_1208892 [Paraphaeosphaeria sporulosa]|uniref:Uncharacterized protein n=1 Tax=Paraphaeosphaeria sporulosa TaxID=1460663 RepID=A0A177C504_9PLEO|nr:uncharacterized protein CC84DRAFT_1208892 [Paraphaeosphaeria sporulosa]OAG01848.1 hypothetical protein CC84DRAFT_1208892 [Paraphaeosphaeria sporulosa]